MRGVVRRLACRMGVALLLAVGAPSGAIASVPPTGGTGTDGPRDGDSAVATAGWRTLDDFRGPARWSATASDQVGAKLVDVEAPDGSRSLCLDYDFHGVSGYAVMRRELPMQHPAHFEYAFDLRGEAPVNNFEIKLADASGDNVWWVSRPNWPIPREWTEVRLKERHFSFAWGPRADRTLRDTRHFELTISAGREGGAGRVCLADLRFRERAPPPAEPASRAFGADAEPYPVAVDGDRGSVPHVLPPTWPLQVDLGREREFGGVIVHWVAPGRRRYWIDTSFDGRDWRPMRLFDADVATTSDRIALPETEARWLRLRPLEDFDGDGDVDAEDERKNVTEFEVMPLAWAATPNDFVRNVAMDSPRGHWPRGFSGEQPYWTLVGIDGGTQQGLIGEDGAIELYRGGPSVEPFVLVDGQWVAWADVETTQSLQDGYLPVPTVRWAHPQFALETTAFARGDGDAAQLFGTYRLTNNGEFRRRFTLALALRPLQVNAPKQFLTTPGGVSTIRSLRYSDAGVAIDDSLRLRTLVQPDAALARSFDAGGIAALLADAAAIANDIVGDEPCRSASGPCNERRDALAALGRHAAIDADATGLATGAWVYTIELAPGESREIAWVAPLSGELPTTPIDAAAARAEAAASWHAKLDHATFRVPPAGQHLVDTLRTALAHMLVSRTGPRLQPGTRSYARAWIRDGAMINEGLLRLGRGDVAADFVAWYAPFQFDDGKVPCCVDDRGADPVPENDSHGELVYAIAELYRYTGDKERLRRYWPNVVAAVRYMDALRASQRTEAVRAAAPAHFGLMPASISHEGYSAKPMHSYWDDFWALRGYKDAVQIAQWLGEDASAREFAAARDQFAADLYASIAVATKAHGITFIPGSAELGDFDATSTTIALAPGGEQHRLPQPLLANTFERYWREFVARRDGTKEWEHYTPYELRTVGTFVRLGWRERAHEALDFFFADQQPRGWNQWAEVVSRTPREPFFVGDLPHAWVASDYVRSALDLFAYEDGDALVLAAGLPPDWLSGLRTPWGEVAYGMRANTDTLRVEVSAGAAPPDGRVLTWPYAGPPGPTTVNGSPATWHDGRLLLPAGDVVVESALR
jgi:hypothetical protein